MRHYILTLILSFGLTSCSNAFRDFPDKSSDQYYIDVAKLYLNQFKFTEAIEKILPVLETQPRNAEVVEIAMLAYAGRAGLRVLDLILTLGSDSGSSSFFRIFAEHFPGATDDDIADIQAAIDILEGYESDATLRDSELNLIGMFLYYSRIGVTLNRYAYDGDTILPSFDQCDPADLPDAPLTQIVQSVPKALTAASNLSSGGVSDALDGLTSTPAIQAFAGDEDAECPADAAPCQRMRSLIGEGALGIGLGSGVAAVCP